MTAVLAVTLLVLLATRVPGIGQGLWNDEVLTAADYVLPGPSAIWDADRFIPNNHPLFSLLAWVLTSLTSATEIVLRLGSIVPGIVGVLVVVAHGMRRWALAAGVLAAAFLASHGLHQELVPQARGYGLAFLAGALTLVAADAAVREPEDRRHVTALGVAGFVGTATFVVFVVPLAFLFVALVAFRTGPARRFVLATGAVVFVAIGIWWLPLLPGVLRESSQEFGSQLAVHGPVTGWLHHLGITQLGDLTSVPGPLLLAGRGLFAVLVVSTVVACVRRDEVRRAVVIVGPLVATYTVLAVGRFFVEPRFSLHLLPFFTMAVVVGPADFLARLPLAPKRAAIAVLAVLFAVPLLARVGDAADAASLPAEAYAGAARAIEQEGGSAPVVTNSVHPVGLRHYLERDVAVRPTGTIERNVCAGVRPIIVVDNPYLTTPISFDCPRAADADVVTLQQRTRGGYLRVWFFPATDG